MSDYSKKKKRSMDSISYTEQLQKHYEECWHSAAVLRWTKGPIHELPESFSVLLFQPTDSREMWTYATCGMSLPTDLQPLELHLFAPERNDQIVELLTAVAHYYHTASF